jgi:hypothetical protein
VSTKAEREYLAGHRAHDFDALMSRWQAVAEAAGLEPEVLAQHGGYSVVGYRSTCEWDNTSGLYICAGVHGDEPAGVWGLLEWAEENVRMLGSVPVLVLPCFNPWGLVENRRSDHRGRDLNRLFDRSSPPLFKAWRKFVGTRKFRLALNLHEDYDAQGIYIYELGRRGVDFGPAILEKCEKIIPVQHGSEIDGSPFENGVLVRKQDFGNIVDRKLEGGGLPEAIYLRMNHAQFALTFETPSEYSLWKRVRAQKKFLEVAIDAAGSR